MLEVRYSEDALRGLFYIPGHDSEPLVMVKDTCGEEHDSQKEGHEVLESLIVQHAHVFKVIAGFDIADGFFDAPASDVGPNPAPQTPEAVAQRLGGEQHERLLSKTMNDQ